MAEISSLETLNLDTFLDEHTDMDDAYLARGIHVDKIQDKIGEIITQANLSASTNVSPVQIAEVTLTATEIVGNAAGDVAHADGAPLVAAQGAGYALEFISALLIYDYATGAYADGGDDMVINVGVTGAQVAFTTAIAKADLLGASADKVVQVNALSASDQAITVAGNNIISLYAGTAFGAGTGAGVLKCHVAYRVHTLGL